MKIAITLISKDQSEQLVEVEYDTVCEATMVMYRGRCYTYKSMAGISFKNIQFQECLPPVAIP